MTSDTHLRGRFLILNRPLATNGHALISLGSMSCVRIVPTLRLD